MQRMLIIGFALGLCLLTGTATARTTSTTYTPEGLIASIDGPRTDVADVTTYTYDAAGNRATMTNALGQVTHYTDYDGAGRLLRLVDPNGFVVSFTYHPRGWLLSQTLGEGADVATTQYDYDPAGNLIRLTPASGASLAFTYDAANRLTAITDAQGNVQRYTLDALGNRVSEQTEDAGGTVVQQLSRVYNTLNRLQQQIGADPARTMDYAYDPNGNLTGTTDALSRVTTAGYDALDRLISQLDPANGQTGFAYDDRDNLTAVTDPRGNTTTYGYNAFDETISQHSPDTGDTTYTYDEAGNLTSQTDARGVTVNYTYDALNRLTGIHYPDPTLAVSFTYDQGPHGIGRLTQMSDAAGTTDYGYDPRGNLIQETRTAGALVTTVGYAYDNADRLVSLRYPSGYQVHYAYDTVGQLSTVTLERPDASTQVLAEHLQYLPFGPLKAMTYGNGLDLSRTYDLDYRLTGQQIPGLRDDSYVINAVDNLTAWQDSLDPTRDQHFDYDALDRLITAQGPYGDLGYTYDANGNRLSLTQALATDTYVIDLASNRLIETQGGLGSLFSYDAAGNTIASARGDFDYDDTQRLVRYSAPGITAHYAYNGRGERVGKTVNDTVTHFRYANRQLIGEYDASGKAIREYAYLDGQVIAVLLPQASGEDLPPAVDFNAQPVLSYGPSQDISGTVSIEDGGATLRLVGNTWQRIASAHTLTPTTVLTVDFYSAQAGEIHAIGFDNGTAHPADQYFQVYGVQRWGVAAADYAGSGWQTLTIPVGNYLTGSFSHLVFVMDDDANAAGESRFRNLRLTEAHSGPATVVAEVTFTDAALAPFSAEQDVSGTAVIEDGGATLRLTGNTWKRLAFPHTITHDTVLAFEFHSGTAGEIHGIAFEDDAELSPAQTVQIHGTQAWGDIVGPPYLGADSGDGWQQYQIPVGQYLTGSFPYLVFINDDDAAASGQSAFRHVRLMGEAAPPAGGADHIYYAHTDHLGAVTGLTDQAGHRVWDAARLPFGELTVLTSDVVLPLRFPGQYYDEESGLHYNYFRDYDPTTGRYIQSDPIGLAGGLNTYAYAYSNPIGITDPLGLYGSKLSPRPIPFGGYSPTNQFGNGSSFGNTHGFNNGSRERTTRGSYNRERYNRSAAASASSPKPSAPLPGTAANDSEFGGGGDCPDCREWLKALNRTYHALSALDELSPGTQVLRWQWFWAEVKKYEAQCGPYQPPPSFDDIYQR